jgi:hypothetical protein
LTTVLDDGIVVGIMDDESTLLLENVGADAAARFGDPAVWRTAVGQLK